jgi:hypothetical protein
MIYSVYYTYKKDETGKGYIGMHGGPMKGYLGSGVLLKKAIKEFGREAFAQEIILITEDKHECHFFEGLFIKSYQTTNEFGGYNISPNGGWTGIDGYKHTEETKKKIGFTSIGRYLSKKSKDKISKANKGKNLSKGMTNKHHTEETKAHLSLINKGKHHTKETKRKISLAKQNMSEETKKKIGLASKNRNNGQNNPMSKENRLKRKSLQPSITNLKN